MGALLAAGCALIAACGGSGREHPELRPGEHRLAADDLGRSDPPAARGAASAPQLSPWPEFGLDPQRSDATEASTGITAANVGKLHVPRVTLPGDDRLLADLPGGRPGPRGTHDVVVMTTSYGRTFAIDANSGKRLWTYTPPGYSGWVGSAQITNSSPLLEHARHRYVYAASPDGVVHKLSLASGKEVRSGHWPVTVSRDPTKEKMGSALNVDGPYLIATTSGYIGDIPVYQGHVVLIDRASGKIGAVFNTLCANRRAIIVPTSCPESDSAILSRGGAVVEPGGRRLLVDTGNATWDGRRYFGDSVLELTVPGLRLRQSYTPRNQAN